MYYALSLLILFSCSVQVVAEELPWDKLPAMEFNGAKDEVLCKVIELGPYKEPESSVDVNIHHPEENSYGPANWIILGSTCLKAMVSMRLYKIEKNKKYEHYSISIEAPRVFSLCISQQEDGKCETKKEEVQVELYKQLLTKEMVGEAFVGATMSQIVRFDEKEGAVVFHINEDKYEYKLPEQEF